MTTAEIAAWVGLALSTSIGLTNLVVQLTDFRRTRPKARIDVEGMPAEHFQLNVGEFAKNIKPEGDVTKFAGDFEKFVREAAASGVTARTFVMNLTLAANIHPVSVTGLWIEGYQGARRYLPFGRGERFMELKTPNGVYPLTSSDKQADGSNKYYPAVFIGPGRIHRIDYIIDDALLSFMDGARAYLVVRHSMSTRPAYTLLPDLKAAVLKRRAQLQNAK